MDDVAEPLLRDLVHLALIRQVIRYRTILLAEITDIVEKEFFVLRNGDVLHFFPFKVYM